MSWRTFNVNHSLETKTTRLHVTLDYHQSFNVVLLCHLPHIKNLIIWKIFYKLCINYDSTLLNLWAGVWNVQVDFCNLLFIYEHVKKVICLWINLRLILCQWQQPQSKFKMLVILKTTKQHNLHHNFITRFTWHPWGSNNMISCCTWTSWLEGQVATIIRLGKNINSSQLGFMCILVGFINKCCQANFLFALTWSHYW